MTEPRVPAITNREQLPREARPRFDAIEESRGGVRGPFRVLLHAPSLAGRVADLGAAVRFEGALDPAVRELAILATAFEWDAAYVWAAHEPLAVEAGVGSEAIEAIRGERPLEELSGVEESVVQYVGGLLRDHEVPERTFADVRDALGTAGTVELTTTVGYYGLMAGVCRAFRVLPEDD